ncbi:MAG: CoA-binding protein [candidate division Zixibacteria bacterium]|nr:CoA-binding protein [candidate division Zixibacteria bacterium]
MKIGAKAIWLQEGVVNDSGALRAQAAGLVMVQDRCIKKELTKL